MIYFVSNQPELFNSEEYTMMSKEESLVLLNTWEMYQFDSETTGRDAHINSILLIQFGNIEGDIQVVVDTTTVSPLYYKSYIESHYMVGQNLKFDLQFLYNYSIIPLKVYDTMIVEQLLYLGYPPYGKFNGISYALSAIAKRRIDIDIDKTVRGEIIWRGIDTKVIVYAATDVKYLGDIMKSQLIDCRNRNCLVGAKLECDFVPAISYLEWCGVKLDESRWKYKMQKDLIDLEECRKELDKLAVSWNNKSFYTVNNQGDLFNGFDTEPKCNINWSSSAQVIKVAKYLGFDTKIQDKNTGEDKDSVLEKYLKAQKGINDTFLKLYFNYQEKAKVVSSFGQSHLDSVNPVTGRLHTSFKQLGATSGRLSCGSKQGNNALAIYKKLAPGRCKYVNLQQLPANEETRSSFVAEDGNLFISCDYSAEESRLGADIYNDEAFRNEFLYGSKDTHNMFAWAVFRKECEALGCKSALDVKKLAPQWRKKVKGVEFAYMFGAAAPTIAQSAECSIEEAQNYINTLDKEFVGMSSFAKKGSDFVRKNGYIIINPVTGHRLNWHDHKEWLDRQKSFTRDFWESYRLYHKGTGDNVATMVSTHFRAASKYDRLARNTVTQGTGAIIMKEACINLFKWIIDNNMFNKIKICVLVHDEINCEYPEELSLFPSVLQDIMEKAASKYCKSLPIPAEPEVAKCWKH